MPRPFPVPLILLAALVLAEAPAAARGSSGDDSPNGNSSPNGGKDPAMAAGRNQDDPAPPPAKTGADAPDGGIEGGGNSGESPGANDGANNPGSGSGTGDASNGPSPDGDGRGDGGEGSGQVSLADAKANIGTIIQSFVAKRSVDGAMPLRDKTTKKLRRLELVKVEDRHASGAGASRYTAPATMKDLESGQILTASFTVDFGGAEWKVVGMRLKPPAAKK